MQQSRPMAILPNTARPPLPLDSLVARYASQPRAKAPPARPAPIPLRDLERPLRPALSIENPRAAVLTITVATCACGSTHRLPNPILLRYGDTVEANLNSIHHTRSERTDDPALPRERREHHITVPYCEDCF